jgi:hypothetical protein
MKALKITNAILVATLLVTASVWLIKGRISAGGMTALALPTITFAASYIALQRETNNLARFGLWLNALLLALFVLVDVLVLFVFHSPVGNAVAIIAFQALLITLPTIANIIVFIRMRAAQ